MTRSIATSRIAPCLVAALALAAGPAPAAERATFELEVLPSLITPRGELFRVSGADINDRGQVTGSAGNADPEVDARAAFRWGPNTGMEDLDPTGLYRSGGVAINNRGVVFGFQRRNRQDLIFLHSPNAGFDLLERGSAPFIVRGFFVGTTSAHPLPRTGHLLGTAASPQGLETPLLYTAEDGWTALSGVHLRFARENTRGAYLHRKGHILFVVVNPPEPGETPPFGHQEPFLLLSNGRLFELASPGRPVSVPGRCNGAGRVPGLYVDDRGLQRAYVFTPARGLVDIHPQGFRESFAGWVTEDGRVIGQLAKRGRFDRIFVHTDADGLEILVPRRKFARLARRRGVRLRDVAITDVNNRGQIVGVVGIREGPDLTFLYSPRFGLVDLDAVVAELTSDFRLDRGSGGLINNNGQVLVDGVEVAGQGDDDRSTVAVLSVVE